MQILPATLEDARAIAEIHVATWYAAYENIIPTEHLATQSVDKREAMWRETIIKGTPALYVAKCDFMVTGWIAFGPCRDAGALEYDGEVWAIYVASSHWSSGVGRALWFKARSLLIDQGYKRATLWVLADNSRAIQFYLAAGFSPEPASKKEVLMAGKSLKEVRYIATFSA